MMNFTSRMLAQVLKLLRIKHNVSAAYHPGQLCYSQHYNTMRDNPKARSKREFIENNTKHEP